VRAIWELTLRIRCERVMGVDPKGVLGANPKDYGCSLWDSKKE